MATLAGGGRRTLTSVKRHSWKEVSAGKGKVDLVEHAGVPPAVAGREVEPAPGSE
jgi:hypothetical protein